MASKFAILIAAACLVAELLARPTGYEARHFSSAEDIEASYDYIIVGGGTSGLTVADRLTQDGKCKKVLCHAATEYLITCNF